jgi:putative tryptophan/tyrosine transport system substrate-binding protein
MTASRVALTVTLGLTLLAAPLVAGAQQAGKLPIIGVLEAAAPALNQRTREAFRQGLEQHGWVEGRNVVIEYRSADGRTERFLELAAELVRRNVSVIVVAGEPAIIAARQATTTVPIVMAAVGDPVGRGFVASLARPGGNITGVSNLAVEMTGKWVELLKEAVPKAMKVAALRNPTNPTHAVFWSQTQEAARALGVQAQPAEAKNVEEIDLAFAAMAKERPGALIVFPDPLFNGNRARVAGLAERYRMPWLGMFRDNSADVGALMSYGPNILDNFRRAAGFVDRILKGAKPADMPVEQARQFELVINLKTAKVLGLTIPPSLLARADEVIQ